MWGWMTRNVLDFSWALCKKTWYRLCCISHWVFGAEPVFRDLRLKWQIWVLWELSGESYQEPMFCWCTVPQDVLEYLLCLPKVTYFIFFPEGVSISLLICPLSSIAKANAKDSFSYSAVSIQSSGVSFILWLSYDPPSIWLCLTFFFLQLNPLVCTLRCTKMCLFDFNQDGLFDKPWLSIKAELRYSVAQQRTLKKNRHTILKMPGQCLHSSLPKNGEKKCGGGRWKLKSEKPQVKHLP